MTRTARATAPEPSAQRRTPGEGRDGRGGDECRRLDPVRLGVGTPRILAAIRTDDGSLAGLGSGGSVPVIIRGQRWATADEVTAGFAAASTMLEVPVAHAILRRSVIEFHTGEYRLCVIDACSAAETA